MKNTKLKTGQSPYLLRHIAIIIFIEVLGWGVQCGRLSAQSGEEYYKKNKIDEAISVWQHQLEKQPQNWALYYNLGNAWMQKQEYPKAVLNYESAALLAPYEEKINQNLRVARGKLPEHLSFFGNENRWLKAISSWPDYVWGLASLLCLVIALLMIHFQLRKSVLNVSGYILPIIFVLTSVILISVFFVKGKTNGNEGIVMAYLVSIKETPEEGGVTVIQVPGGNKVEIIKKEGQWLYVALENGESGWLEDRMIARLR